MGKRVRLKQGDIFRIPLDGRRFGLGQIIEPGIVFLITVLRTPVEGEFEPGNVETTDILLCGRTTDAQFFHDRWHVVGNLPLPEPACIPRPRYKVGREGTPWITDFDGKLLRPATAFEWDNLDYQKSSAPGLYEDAFKAHHGVIPDKPHYAKYRIEHMRAQAALASDRKPAW